MMKLKNKLGITLTMLFLLITVFVGCKKKDVILEPSKSNVELLKTKKSAVSVADLKIYFGEITRLDTSKIDYNSTLQKFFINGKEQISYKELKENYLKFPIVYYKDGLPTVK